MKGSRQGALVNSTQPGRLYDPAWVNLSSRLRYRLAQYVVIGSFLTLFLLVGALLGIAQVGGKEAADVADKTFNTILPVLAGWVGTVLAFYFSALQSESTNRSLQQAIGRIDGGPPSQARVTARMIPVSSIRHLQTLDDGHPPSSFNLAAALRPLFDPQAPGGAVTRLVFVERGQFRYVIHVGTLNAFLGLPPPAERSIGDLTLDDLLKNDHYRNQIANLVAFVGTDATLAQAKTALDAVAGAQDIIVTSTGDANGQVLGWITNVDLIKALAV
jgi:hypothetical protein